MMELWTTSPVTWSIYRQLRCAHVRNIAPTRFQISNLSIDKLPSAISVSFDAVGRGLHGFESLTMVCSSSSSLLIAAKTFLKILGNPSRLPQTITCD